VIMGSSSSFISTIASVPVIIPVPGTNQNPDGVGIPWLPAPDQRLVDATANLINDISQAIFDLMTWRYRLAFRVVQSAHYATIGHRQAISATVGTNITRAASLEDAHATVRARDGDNATIIYRTGTGSFMNLTPRPRDVGGLSYQFSVPAQGPFTVTSIEALNATGVLRAIVDGKDHISVMPIPPSLMPGWIESRVDADNNPHALTRVVRALSIRVG